MDWYAGMNKGGTMSFFLCPVCGKTLIEEPTACRCENGHSIDKAKSGYINLLMPGSKHSAQPGDDKRMVNARADFLSGGYYAALLDALCEMALRYLPQGKHPVILDAGCGEGYYTAGLYQFLTGQGISPRMAGVDISKLAVNKAAKRNKEISFAVASVFHLPVRNCSCDMFLNLFAPFCQSEILRVLGPQGRLILVIPGKNHLWELKQVVYDEPYQNEVKDFAVEGLNLLENRELCFRLSLANPQDIDSLFQMTPYYYKTSREGYQRLLACRSLDTTVQFHLLAYQKK